MTVILENAGETVILEGIKAQEYLERQAANEIEKEKEKMNRQERNEKIRNDKDNADAVAKADKAINSEINNRATTAYVAGKRTELAEKKHGWNSEEYKKNDAEYHRARDNRYNVDRDEYTDAVMRHQRRHGSKNEECGN